MNAFLTWVVVLFGSDSQLDGILRYRPAKSRLDISEFVYHLLKWKDNKMSWYWTMKLKGFGQASSITLELNNNSH